MSVWSWIVQENDPEIVKQAVGSQYNKVKLRVTIMIAFVLED